MLIIEKFSKQYYYLGLFLSSFKIEWAFGDVYYKKN
jgi:hypothetical protein